MANPRNLADISPNITNGKVNIAGINASGTPSASTALLGNGTWGTFTTAPAGSNGQVQFNNSGSFGSDGGLYWDNTNKRLGINNTNTTEALNVVGRIKMGTGSYILSDNATQTYYISTTGNDTTGNGTNANPWATLSKALDSLARILPYAYANANIVLKNGTYTMTSMQYIRGFLGGGTINIQAETAGSVTVNMAGYYYQIERNDIELTFSGITFQTASTPTLFSISDTYKVVFNSNCAINQMVTSNNPGNFNQAIGVSNSGFTLSCPLTVYNESSYGAVINLYSGTRYDISGTISKSGTRHGNAAISPQGNAEGQLRGTINNFNIGVNMGRSHYDAECSGIAIANNMSATNCNIGVQLSNNGTFKNYYIASFSGTTTPVYWINGWYSGQYGAEYAYIGYNTSVSSSYRLQVNSQIYATSSTIATSDGRYKKNVSTIQNGLDIVKALRPVQFDWIPHDIHNFDTEHTTVGFIAQEVKEVLAETDYVDSIVKPHYITREAEEYETVIITPATEEVIDENGNLVSLASPPVTEKVITKPAVKEEFFGIAEGNLIAILTKAIQEQQVMIDQLRNDFEAYKASHP